MKGKKLKRSLGSNRKKRGVKKCLKDECLPLLNEPRVNRHSKTSRVKEGYKPVPTIL